MTLPNFLIIGAARGGTTSLHYLLSQHLEVYRSSIKAHFFFWANDDPKSLRGPGAELVQHGLRDKWTVGFEPDSDVPHNASGVIRNPVTRFLSLPIGLTNPVRKLRLDTAGVHSCKRDLKAVT